MPVSWNLAGGGFGSALDFGMRIGADMRGRREEKEQRAALAAYALDPNDQNAAAVAPYAPQVVMQHRQMQAGMAAKQQEKQQADAQTVRALLKKAGDSPEGWQQAMSAAQDLGLDTSKLPQAYDPDWAKRQLFIFDAMQTQEGQEAASGLGKEAMDMGFKPGTPEFQAKVSELWQQKGAIPYTGPGGETRLYIPGKQSGGPEPGAIVDGYKFNGGNPRDKSNWTKVGGDAGNGVGGFPAN